LQSLTARSPILTTVGSLLGTYLNSVVVENSAINASSMSQMLVDLDTNGQSGGTILATGGTNAGVAALTVAGAAAKTSLEGKGWSVLLNP
jgi:uncharacterized membrane protein (UPF0136 family)